MFFLHFWNRGWPRRIVLTGQSEFRIRDETKPVWLWAGLALCGTMGRRPAFVGALFDYTSLCGWKEGRGSENRCFYLNIVVRDWHEGLQPMTVECVLKDDDEVFNT